MKLQAHPLQISRTKEDLSKFTFKEARIRNIFMKMSQGQNQSRSDLILSNQLSVNRSESCTWTQTFSTASNCSSPRRYSQTLCQIPKFCVFLSSYSRALWTESNGSSYSKQSKRFSPCRPGRFSQRQVHEQIPSLLTPCQYRKGRQFLLQVVQTFFSMPVRKVQ